MSNNVFISPQDNNVSLSTSNNIVVITDSDQNQVSVTQPVTNVIQVNTIGPIGPTGLQGPSGSFDNVSGSFTTTASFNAFTASYNTGSFTGSFTGSGNITSLTASNSLVTGNVTVLGTASINTLIVNQTQLSTGSNQLGDAADDTQTLYGTVRIPTGSLVVSGSFTNRLTSGTTDFIVNDSNNRRLQVNGSLGFVGIGAFSINAVPDVAIDLRGSTRVRGLGNTSATTALLVQNSNLTSSLTVDDAGTVFLGSASISNGILRIERSTGNTGIIIRGSDGNFISAGGAPAYEPYNYANATHNWNIGHATLGSYNWYVGTNSTLTSNTFLMRLTRSGSLLIGTTTESAKLYISGSSVDNLLKIDSPASSSILFVSGSGNVGIGTSTPLRQLHVLGDIEVTKGIYGDATDHTFYTIASGSFHHRFYTRTSGGTSLERFTIQGGADTGSTFFQNTNVGIGTTTPSASLHISGSSGSVLFEIDSNSQQNILYVSGSSNIGVGTNSPQRRLHIDTSGSGTTDTQLALTSTDVNNRIGILFASSSLASGRQHKLLHRNNSPRGEWILNASAGESGIWRFLPTDDIVYSLSITTPFNGGTASITTGASQSLLSLSAGIASSTLNISASGNVGIGTTTPNTRLTVIDSTNTVAATFGGGVASPGTVGIGTVNSGVRPFIQAYTAGGSTTALTLQPVFGTLVGIGTTSPTAALHISGSSGSALLQVDSPASSSILFVSGSGRVGIGIATPSSSLDIRGAGTATGLALKTQDSAGVVGLTVLDKGWIGNKFNTPTALLQSDTFIDQQYADDGSKPTWLLTYNGAQVCNMFMGSGYEMNIANPSAGSNNGLYFLTGGLTTAFRRMSILRDGNVGIGTSTPTSRLQIRGSGTTSATNTFRLENSSALPSLIVTDDLNSRFFGNVGVGTTPSASLHVAGNTILSGSAGTGSALTVYKSGSTVMSIQGSQGELFSITDSLSGSLFSVSNISGLPILEVFSDNTVLLGSYLDPMLMTTQRVTANSGSTVIYSLPTASYDGVFVDYVIRSGSNARAGQFMGMWSGSSTNYTDNSTTDFGSTSGFIFGLIISGSNMVLTGSATTSGWTVRAGIRSI